MKLFMLSVIDDEDERHRVWINAEHVVLLTEDGGFTFVHTVREGVVFKTDLTLENLLEIIA